MRVSKEKQTNDYLNKITFFLLSIITATALNVKDVSFVMSFGGATLGNALIYVLPAVMFRKVVKDMGDNASQALKNEVGFATFSCLLGIGMGAVGATMAVKALK